MPLSKQEEGLTKLHNDVRATFSTPEGERVLLWLMRYCHLRETSTTQGFEPYQAMFRDGERSVVLEIMKYMPDIWAAEKFQADITHSQKVMNEYFPEVARDA